MRFRVNLLSYLQNNFTSGTQIDSLSKKWPKAATPYFDNNRWDAGEKLLVPSLNRIIRSDHFNALSDAIVRCQYFIRDNAGKTYLVNTDGSVTSCVNDFVLPVTRQITGASNTVGSGVTIIQSNTTVSFNPDYVANNYNFTVDINIPSEFGVNPWASNNFGVLVSTIVDSPNDSGYWANTSNPLTNISKNWTLVTSYAPHPTNNTQLRVSGKVLRSSTVAGSALATFSWVFDKNYSSTQVNTSNIPYKVISPKPNHSSNFEVLALNNNPNFPVATDVGNIVRAWSNLPGGGGGSTTMPYRDSAQTNGATGGIMVRDRAILPDPFPNPLDVYIDFIFHTWHANTAPYTEFGGHFTKAGVFLRLSETNRTTTKNLVLNGVDYGNFPMYTGYFLRFNTDLITRSSPASSYDTIVGSWAILKIENEQFGAEYKNLAQYWDRGNTIPGTPPLNTPIESTALSDPHGYGALPPARLTVLARSSSGQEILPIYQRPSLNLSSMVRRSNPKVYRFQIIGNVIRLRVRDLSSSTWTDVASVTDASPLTIHTSATKYYPSGVYTKGNWGTVNSSNSADKGPEASIGLSNIVEGVFATTPGNLNANINTVFYSIPASPTIPTIT